MSSGKITNKKTSPPVNIAVQANLSKVIEESPKAVTKIKVVGDCHARGFAKLIQEKTMWEMVVDELVYPGAKLGEMFSFAKEANLPTFDYLVITAGDNDAYSGKAINVLKNMKSVLISLRPCKILLGGIPFRQDLPLYHEDIFNLNMYFFELSRTMKDVYFMNMTSMSSKCFNGDGIHLNLMGKQNNNNSKQNNFQK